MSPRVKKLIALAILLPFLFAYVFLAASLGERVPNHQALKVAYYFVAGVAWAIPIRWLIIWANREPTPAEEASADRAS